MALKRKNRIMTFAMTAVIALSLAGGLYSGSGRLDEAYDELKYFFVSADPDVVFYNEATRTTINYEVEDGVVTKCEFVGGCPGNTQGVAKLVVGRKVEEVISLLKGIQCRNGTSCPDQLARALEAERA